MKKMENGGETTEHIRKDKCVDAAENHTQIKKKKPGKWERLRLPVLFILLIAALLCGGLSLYDWFSDRRVQKQYEELAEAYTPAQAAREESSAPQEAGEEREPYVSPVDFEALCRENPDTIGWIRIPDTNIDYPIVQTEDNEYYLKRDFYGKPAAAGCIYLDYESQPDFMGRNHILYGHNMKNGSMFKDVVRFKQEDYFKAHQYFSIYTPDREIRLKAVACYWGAANPIVRKTRFKTQQSFDAFVQEMIKPCSFAEPVGTPARSIYILVTCSYEVNDARTFLYAQEVDKDGNEIPPDSAFLQKVQKLMQDNMENAEAQP